MTHPCDPARIDVSPTADARTWTARVELPGGGRVALHSTRDALAEAHRQLGAISDTSPSIVVLIGAGLGYLTEAARQRWPAARILVVEPSPELAHHAHARMPGLHEHVQVLVGPHYDGAEQLWRLFDGDETHEPPVFVHPVLARAMPEAIAYAEELTRRAIQAAQMNARARRENAGRYLLNTLRNLPDIAASADPQAVSGRFVGIPAIIVGAGPSLDRNLAGLRALADRALVFAADTAWRPLATAHVDPNIVVALDPTETNARHLTGVRAQRQPWLLAEPSVDPRALQAFRGRLGTFRVANHHPWPWLQANGLPRPLVRVWGSVLTAAFDLALTFGCDPIIFVGADLAYTDDRPYCRGTTFEDDWARLTACGVSLRQIWQNTLSARTVLTVPGVDGRDVLTAPHLLEFRDWLVARTGEHATRRFINATGAGALVGGHIEQGDLESVLDSQPVRGAMLRDRLQESLRPDMPAANRGEALDALLAMRAWIESRRTDAVPPPVSEWLAFGRPSLTLTDIHGALPRDHQAWTPEGVHTAHAERDAETAAAPEPSRMHAADRVALMRALLSGDQTLLDGTARDDGQVADCGQAWGDGKQALETLLAMRGPLTTAAQESGPAFTDISHVPASLLFAWTPEAVRLVTRIEECSGAMANAHLNSAVTESTAGSFWAAPVTPVIEAERPVSARQGLDSDTSARLAVIGQWHVCEESHEREDPPLARRERRLIAAMLRATRDASLLASIATPYTLEAHGLGPQPRTLPHRIDAYMRALTGTLTSSQPNRLPAQRGTGRFTLVAHESSEPAGAIVEPRLAFLRHEVAYVEPEILTDRGLPRGWICASLDDGAAIVTPNGSTRSVRVDTDGHQAPRPEWPRPISGEMPWGHEGGALAWHQSDGVVLRRGRAGDAVVTANVPFRPSRVAIAPDGTPFWCAIDGGLWEWLPGMPGRLIIETPTCMSVRFDGDDLVLDPVTRDDRGQMQRRRLTYAWRYVWGSRTLQQIDSEPAGQCTNAATRNEWTAWTHQFADLVRFTRTDGRELALACYAPAYAAWAGPSLLVTTADGAVLLFRHLADRLSAHA